MRLTKKLLVSACAGVLCASGPPASTSPSFWQQLLTRPLFEPCGQASVISSYGDAWCLASSTLHDDQKVYCWHSLCCFCCSLPATCARSVIWWTANAPSSSKHAVDRERAEAFTLATAVLSKLIKYNCCNSNNIYKIILHWTLPIERRRNWREINLTSIGQIRQHREQWRLRLRISVVHAGVHK